MTHDLTPEQRAHRDTVRSAARPDVAMVHGRTVHDDTEAVLRAAQRDTRLHPQSEPTTNGSDHDERRRD